MAELPNCDHLYRVQGFHVYGNSDGTFHVLLVDENGGYIFADRMTEDDAEWAAAAFNAVLAQSRTAGDARPHP